MTLEEVVACLSEGAENDPGVASACAAVHDAPRDLCLFFSAEPAIHELFDFDPEEGSVVLTVMVKDAMRDMLTRLNSPRDAMDAYADDAELLVVFSDGHADVFEATKPRTEAY